MIKETPQVSEFPSPLSENLLREINSWGKLRFIGENPELKIFTSERQSFFYYNLERKELSIDTCSLNEKHIGAFINNFPVSHIEIGTHKYFEGTEVPTLYGVFDLGQLGSIKFGLTKTGDVVIKDDTIVKKQRSL